MEIKFRAWHKPCETFPEGTYKYLGLTRYMGSRGILDQFVGCEDAVWEQFTGLHDKNGVEIYEGDVVYLAFGFYGTYFEVRWSKGHWEMHSDAEIRTELLEEYADEVVIKGNIHDNPELLGGGGGE